jgi:hypothetical protein
VRKITFFTSTFASAATAFGLGALAFSSPNAPTTALPQPTQTVTAVPEAQDVAKTATPGTTTQAKAAQAPNSTPTKAKHAKPSTEPEKATQKAATPKHAKPATPGSKGPVKDAEGDGKVLDDFGNTFFPTLPHIPDTYLPFPGDGEGQEADEEAPLIADGSEYPYEEAWGDDPEHAADPGVVCDAELAANLGVPLSPTCSTGHSPVDTWERAKEEATGPVFDLSGGNGWF